MGLVRHLSVGACSRHDRAWHGYRQMTCSTLLGDDLEAPFVVAPANILRGIRRPWTGLVKNYILSADCSTNGYAMQWEWEADGLHRPSSERACRGASSRRPRRAFPIKISSRCAGKFADHACSPELAS